MPKSNTPTPVKCCTPHSLDTSHWLLGPAQHDRTRERTRHKPAGAQTEYTNLQAHKVIEPSAINLKKTRVKEGDESLRTLAMAGETGGEPRAWLAVDETAAAFISRSLSSRPTIILPPPLHRAPLRPGNVVEIAGPSNSGKSHLLLMVREAPFWSKI